MKIDSILDIEDILCNGNIEQIKEVINKYQISYRYSEEYQSLEVRSKKLLEISRGHKIEEKPNCVVFLGKQYKFNEK